MSCFLKRGPGLKSDFTKGESPAVAAVPGTFDEDAQGPCDSAAFSALKSPPSLASFRRGLWSS